MRAAIIGLFTFPVVLHLYSLVQLVSLISKRGMLTQSGRRNVWMAVIVNLLVFGTLLALVVSHG
ncbi:MAG: hypothetical protein HY901_27440 [Deltaproteobacteria bacterium]|nr:hypothetical protein [Deltaproteobacteria bacterium]